MLSDNIITERLILRDMTQEDAKDVFKIWGNSANAKYMSDPIELLEEIVAIFQNDKPRTNYLLVAISIETGEIIGTCCFGPTNKKEEWGFGYSIKMECWGKGYATEIVKAIIKFSYGLGIHDFISSCAIENTASGNVLRKCGMHIDHKSSFKQPKTNIVYESHVYKLHID